jgi:hypothetical protein
MSGVRDTVNSFSESATDCFAIIPLLIMGLMFFLGVLTSNLGLLYLFLGQIVLVPAMSFAANVPGGLFTYLFNGPALTAFKWVISSVIIFTVASVALATETGSSGFSLYGGLVWTLILQTINSDLTILDTYDPVRIISSFMGGTPAERKPIPRVCSLVPGMDETEWTSEQRNSPTAWVVHICFFFGFILSNAVATYTQPIPSIKASSDSAQDERRKSALDARVSNRKTLSAIIGCLSFFIFIMLLYLRLKSTPCEETPVKLLFPVIWTFLLGYAWFYIIYKRCGVKPADVLGIVQGFVSPEMIDGPIVCIGSE